MTRVMAALRVAPSSFQYKRHMSHPNIEPPSNHCARLDNAWDPRAERRAASRMRLRALLRWTSICLCLGLASVAVVHWLAKPDMRAGQWVETAHARPKAPAP